MFYEMYKLCVVYIYSIYCTVYVHRIQSHLVTIPGRIKTWPNCKSGQIILFLNKIEGKKHFLKKDNPLNQIQISHRYPQLKGFFFIDAFNPLFNYEMLWFDQRGISTMFENDPEPLSHQENLVIKNKPAIHRL